MIYYIELHRLISKYRGRLNNLLTNSLTGETARGTLTQFSQEPFGVNDYTEFINTLVDLLPEDERDMHKGFERMELDDKQRYNSFVMMEEDLRSNMQWLANKMNDRLSTDTYERMVLDQLVHELGAIMQFRNSHRLVMINK